MITVRILLIITYYLFQMFFNTANISQFFFVFFSAFLSMFFYTQLGFDFSSFERFVYHLRLYCRFFVFLIQIELDIF